MMTNVFISVFVLLNFRSFDDFSFVCFFFLSRLSYSIPAISSQGLLGKDWIEATESSATKQTREDEGKTRVGLDNQQGEQGEASS